MSDSKSLLSRVLADGLSDTIDLNWILWIASGYSSVRDEDVELRALGVVVVMLLDDLMEPGSLTKGQFVPWSDKGVACLKRIVTDWRQIGTSELRAGDVVWFRLTTSRVSRAIAEAAS